MGKNYLRRVTPFAAAAAVTLSYRAAQASNPIEYPDNGGAQFARAGAWLATGNEPIATHYNPAALATQRTAFSVDMQLAYNRLCYDRRDPGNVQTGPLQGRPELVYLPTCTQRASFPFTLPSIALNWRVNRKLGIGVAVVPPAAYGNPDGAFQLTATGLNTATGQTETVASPYRYMTLNQQSLIVFPTVSVGYELFKNFRVGAGFIAGMAVISTTVANVAVSPGNAATRDHVSDDTASVLRTRDLFVPGAIASLHWSITPEIDVALWGRWLDKVRTTDGSLNVSTQVYSPEGNPNPVCTPSADGTLDTACSRRFPNQFDNGIKKFEFPIPPEVRAGIRYHRPRKDAKPEQTSDGGTVRDPLHDDVFDIELNGSFTRNSAANTIVVRPDPLLSTKPDNRFLPPNADRWNGFIDSYGVRLGGQWNVIRDKLGIRAGGWFETRSQDPKFLSMFPAGPLRYGLGGGLVLRQGQFDFSFGYQHHWSKALDNGGNGGTRATLAVGGSTDQDGPNTDAKDRVDYRTAYAVNGGRLTQSANVFSLGATVRF